MKLYKTNVEVPQTPLTGLLIDRRILLVALEGDQKLQILQKYVENGTVVDRQQSRRIQDQR